MDLKKNEDYDLENCSSSTFDFFFVQPLKLNIQINSS